MSEDLMKMVFIGEDRVQCYGIISFIEHCVKKEVQASKVSFAMTMDFNDHLRFGKWKGETLACAYKNDPPYVRWLLDEGRIKLTESAKEQYTKWEAL
jgi:hypothetical protein